MKISLVVIPFASPNAPSIGLTQLKGRINELYGGSVEVKIHYLNHEYVKYFGSDVYDTLSNNSIYTGINEWLFRKDAFAFAKDNAKEYFQRFYPGKQNAKFVEQMVVKRDGINVLIEKIIDKNGLDNNDLIGINCTFSVVPGLALAAHIKNRNRKCDIILGGCGVKGTMGECLIQTYPDVDYVCSGPGLIAFPELVGILKEKEENPKWQMGANNIPGILTKTNLKTITKWASDLDINKSIEMNYDDFFESRKKLGIKSRPCILLETSRGCQWGKCTFCGLNEERIKYEIKDDAISIKEINDNIIKYQVDIQMSDNVIPQRYYQNVLPNLTTRDNVKLIYEVRADIKDEEFRLLKKARVDLIQPGIESFSTDVLKIMNKGVHAIDALYCLRLSIEYGLLPLWNLIVGFPFMTGAMYEYIDRLICHIYHLFPPSVLTPVRFDRYSEYWKDSAKYGLRLQPFSMYKEIYPFSSDFLENIAYYFEDANYSTIELMLRYFDSMSIKVKNWKERWITHYIRIPKLYHLEKQGLPFVYDSRYSTSKEWSLTLTEKKILEYLDSPKNSLSFLEWIQANQFNDVELAISNLKSRNFIVEECGKVVSLVCKCNPENELKLVKKTLSDLTDV